MNPIRKPSAEEIAAIYGAIEDIDPDISTETLFARVRDHFGGRINDGDIAAALKLSANCSD
ncbi:MAG TPA: hypothetical protein VIF40_17870 [Methylosinus sp.]|jgi:hypothetical protein|uniref:hypothetical protein n=1 Tax=Methylosinus sp. TaxID=427 RepID=UPI002F91EE0E